ncbi:MAG TPA: hypothetical protein HPP77_02345 [Candidatus Hydrogenedentes bacterium]|nr:hypothetical protein [Candidatus Hydrogenedentota bacterium]
MSQGADDIFAKLEAAIAQWSAQLTSAQHDLAECLTQAKAHLNALAEKAAADKARAEVAGKSAVSETAARQQAEREEALDASKRRVAQLEQLLAERESTLRATEERLAELENTQTRLRARDEASRDEIAKAQGQAAKVGELERTLEELKRRAQADHDRATALATEIESAVRARAEAERQIDELRSEIDTLRRANASLTRHPRAPEPTEEEVLLAGTDGAGQKRKMGEILVNADIITAEQLDNALAEQRADPRRRLGAVLVDLGYAEEDVIARALGSQLEIPFIRLDEKSVDEDAARIISGRLARFHTVLPVAQRRDGVILAMANPLDLVAIEDVSLATGKRVEPAVATPSDIEAAIDRLYKQPVA